MLVLLILFVVLLVYKSSTTSYNQDYISRSQTEAWKGAFAVLILFSHMVSYLTLTGPLDKPFAKVLNLVGQMMVVMYFFYSGYGIFESYKSKPGYDRHFLRRRFFPTWLNFALAILLFIGVQACMGQTFEWDKYLLAFTGWESIGNSNWFVFDILVLYLLTKLSFVLPFKKVEWTALALTVFTLVFWAFLRYVTTDKGSYWYNTLWAFPLGAWYSVLKDKVERIALSRKRSVLLMILGSLVAFAVCSCSGSAGLIFNFKTCFFALLIVFISMKWKIGNKALLWLGHNCFSIYILQRLPMIVMTHFSLNEHIYIFAVVAIVSSLLIAWGFTLVTDSISLKLKKIL